MIHDDQSSLSRVLPAPSALFSLSFHLTTRSRVNARRIGLGLINYPFVRPLIAPLVAINVDIVIIIERFCRVNFALTRYIFSSGNQFEESRDVILQSSLR